VKPRNWRTRRRDLVVGEGLKEIEQWCLVGEKHYTLLLNVSIALDSIAENRISLQVYHVFSLPVMRVSKVSFSPVLEVSS